MKTAILYDSWHHGNTKKLCDAIAARYNVDLFDVKGDAPDLSGYDRIGLASGIAYSKFYKDITRYAREQLPEGKPVFLLYTCGKLGDFTKEIRGILAGKGCTVLGCYCCKGFDTYGPLKLIGGLNKGCPTEEDMQKAVTFYETLPEE